jgi:hypothetical protein
MKITLQQLLNVLNTKRSERDPGVLARYFACPKSVTISWTNRKQPDAVNEEAKRYHAANMELIKKFEGKLLEHPSTKATGQSIYTFADGKVEEFGKALEELLAQEIELPGKPAKITDLDAKSISELFSEPDLMLLEKSGFLTE